MSSPAAVALCPYSTQEFLASQNLIFADEAVTSVFSMMLGLTAEAVAEPSEPIAGPHGRTAIVGFSGSMRGSCELRLSSSAACLVTSAMLGGTPAVEEGDDSIDDAVGELCNMIAGGWKNRTECLSSTCALSPPTVISGCDYKIHMNSASVKLKRTYAFDGSILFLTLHCLEPKAPILR
jgi:chemotaxis protein CheX